MLAAVAVAIDDMGYGRKEGCCILMGCAAHKRWWKYTTEGDRMVSWAGGKIERKKERKKERNLIKFELLRTC